MTRCNEEDIDINLKSSVYNQTGQNYFQQLSAYNAMSSHLRRVLLAKSIVNTRNSNYTRNKRYKCRTNYRSRSLECNLSLDVIDKLAYDTEHHPYDILRMNEDSKHRCVRENPNPRQSRYDSWKAHCSHSQICTDRTYSEDARKYTNCTSRSRKKSGSPSPNRKPLTCWSDRHRRCFEEPGYSKEIKFSNPKRNTWKYQNQTCHRPLPKKRRYENEQVCHVCASSFEFSSDVSGPETPKLDTTDVSSVVSPERCIKGNCQKNNEQVIETPRIKKVTNESEDETKYVKFVYDITKEIMQHGLYTDEEIQDVFKKHIGRNKETLNKSKMLQEIHRLKISLNIIDESDEDEYEDYLFTNRFSTLLDAKPPTPPKVLNENKVVEKLQNYKKLLEIQRDPTIASTSNKSVVLIDANPELLVTEQDVLSTLMEMNLDPKQAQSICKSLYYKSRDTSLCQMVQAKVSTSKCLDKHSNTSLILQRDQVIQAQVQDPKSKVIYRRKKIQCNCKTKTALSRSSQTQKIRGNNEKSMNYVLIEKPDRCNDTAKEIRSCREILTNAIEPNLTSESNFDSNRNLSKFVQANITTIDDDRSRTAIDSIPLVSREKEDTVTINKTNEIFNGCVRCTSDVAPIKSTQQEPNVDERIKELTAMEQMVEDREENSIGSIVDIVESIQESLDISDDTVNKISISDIKQIETVEDSNTNTATNSNSIDAAFKDSIEPEVDILQNKKQPVTLRQDSIEEYENSETNLAPIWESDEESDLEANEVSSANSQRRDTFLKRADMKHYFLNLRMSEDFKKKDIVSMSDSTISGNSVATADSDIRFRHQEILPEKVESNSKMCSSCFKKMGSKLKRLKQ